MIRIEMLGGFAIIVNGRDIESGRKSSKIWRLIEYLAVNKNRAVPQDELLEIFCSDESKINPGSVLRTMVYRARTTLAEAGFPHAADIITAKNGCYLWNSNIQCSTDTEELEEYSKKAAALGSDDGEKLSLLLKIAELYKGDFLQGGAGDVWTMPLVRYYRGLFTDAVYQALDLLLGQGRIKEAEGLSVKALGIDPYDEYFILSYLRSLLRQDRNAEAFEVYKKMESMFFDELGVDFSDELHDMYKEIRQAGDAGDASLQEVVMHWLADMSTDRAYCCDPSDFKTLCRIESLSAQRSGHNTFIVRFNVRHKPDKRNSPDNRKESPAKYSMVMKNLENAITSCLRASDIYTRYTANQYMVMLRSLTYEDCKMLVSKILKKVDNKYLPDITDTQILHVTPGMILSK